MIAGYLVMIVGGLLAFAPQFADCYTMPKLVLIPAGCFLGWLSLYKQSSGWLLPQDNPLGKPILFFFFSMLASSVVSSDMGMSIFGAYGAPTYGILSFLTMAEIFYVTSWVSFFWDRPIELLIICGGVMGIYAICQIFHLDIGPIGLPDGRAISTIGSPVYLGNIFAMLIPLALGDALNKRIIALPMILAMTGGLLATRSRGSIIAAGVGCAAVIFLQAGRIWKRIALVSIAVFIFAALLVHRGSGSTSDLMRLETWQAAVSAFKERPLLGYGPDTFLVAFRKHRPEGWMANTASIAVQDNAHNDWLQIASTMGLLGILAYIYLHIVAIKIIRGNVSDHRAGIIGAFYAAFVFSKMNPVPYSAVMIMAILLGHASNGLEGSLIENPRKFSAAGMVISFICLSAGIRIAAADWHYHRAQLRMRSDFYQDGIREMRRALELSPFNIEYKAHAVDHLFWLARYADDGETKKILYDEGALIGMDAVKNFPDNPFSWQILGTSELGVALHGHNYDGTLSDALLHLDHAQQEDPFSFPIMRLRMQAAWTLGRRAKTEEIARDFRRLNGMSPVADQSIFKCLFCMKPWSVHRIRK